MPVPTQDNTTQKTRKYVRTYIHTYTPRAGFEPTIPVFERSKTINALDSAAIGTSCILQYFTFQLLKYDINNTGFVALEICALGKYAS